MPEEIKKKEATKPKKTEFKKPPEPKKATEPLISASQFVQELQGKEAMLGRGFITYLKIQRRSGKQLKTAHTTAEWRELMTQWSHQPIVNSS